MQFCKCYDNFTEIDFVIEEFNIVCSVLKLQCSVNHHSHHVIMHIM